MAENKNKCKKAGRGRDKCARFKAQSRRERNKVRKLIAHLRRQPNDRQALGALEHPSLAGIRPAEFTSGKARELPALRERPWAKALGLVALVALMLLSTGCPPCPSPFGCLPVEQIDDPPPGFLP